MRSTRFSALFCLALSVLGAAATAQPAPDAALPVVSTPSPAPATLSGPELQHLVAPVALYPDQVLTNILAASTYPAQVVEAQRFAADPAHAGLTAATLADAAAGQDWDPSVKALLMFPQVLQMMDGNLDWTEHLGRAFIAQQADVMNATQQLRLAAEQSGALATGPYATVVNEGGDIAIDPPTQQDIYLPTYQPDCVFGPNPACDGLDTELDWAGGILLPYGYLPWGFVDWADRNIRLAHPGYGGEARFRTGGSPELGSVWRHANRRMASGRITGNPSQFNYAPPANTQLAPGVNFARQALPSPRITQGVRFNAAPVFRPAPHVAGAPRPAPGNGHH